MDARRILPPRSSRSRAERTPCPCNKPGLAASVPSLHHRNHQPESTLPSPQGLGHSIYQPTPGPSRRYSFTTSITYGANAWTEGITMRELISPAIKQSASTTSCAMPVTPPKAPSSSGYLVTCWTSYHLARPTTDQRRQPTNSNKRTGHPDAENTPTQLATVTMPECIQHPV